MVATAALVVISADQILKFSHKSIPIVLTEGTFALWQHQILLKTNCHSLQGYLDSFAQPSEFLVDESGSPVSNPAYDVFLQQDGALASWMLSLTGPRHAAKLVKYMTSSAIWNKIQQEFSVSSTTTVMHLHC